GLFERSARSAHRDASPVNGDLHPPGDGDGLFTDPGHGYSCLSSPHVGKDLAAHAELASLAVGEDALRGGQDSDSEAAQDSGNLSLAGVNALARLGEPLKAGEPRLSGLSAVQPDDHRPALPCPVG